MTRAVTAAGATVTWGLGCAIGVGLTRGLGSTFREEWGEVPEGILIGYAIALLVGVAGGATAAFTLTGAWLTSRDAPRPWGTPTVALALALLPLGAALLLGIEPADGMSPGWRARQIGAWSLVLLAPVAAMALVGRPPRTGPDDAVWSRSPPSSRPQGTDTPVWERPPR